MEPNLKHGDILVCRRDSFLSNIIRKATKSEWSHTSLVIEVWGVLYIVEMQSKGIELISYTDWKEKWGYEYIIYRNSKAPLMYKAIAKSTLQKVGKRTKYDYFTFIFRIPWKLKTERFRYRGEGVETRRMICSQFTGWVWNLKNWWKMTPDDQYIYLESSTNWKQIKK